ncbi:MAG TPA: hypothetical protein IAA29_08270 [Candidatus Paenibacillus intestinavium]|nr:hypothetical protein [Candidatus Paenibacillus intestinavium]
MVRDSVDKAISLVLGLAVASKDKIDSTIDELVQKGQVSKEESTSLVQTLLQKGEETKLSIETMVQERVQSLLREQRVATLDDIARLEKRIEDLENSRS